MNRVPREEAEPLAFGRLLHEVFESKFKYGNMEVALDKCRTDWYSQAMMTVDSFERTSRLSAITQLKDLEEPLALWEDKYTINQTLEVEEPFEFNFGGFTYVGRPDRVVIIDDNIWHVQNRGLNSSTNFGVYCNLAKRHYHEHIYAEALVRKYYKHKYGGTIFNLVRKLKYHTKNGKTKSLEEMFYQFPMSIDIDSSLHCHVMESILAWTFKMEEDYEIWLKDGVVPPPGESMNGGLYGNSPDVYFRVLTGEIKLDDDRYFKDRKDPYAVLQNQG